MDICFNIVVSNSVFAFTKFAEVGRLPVNVHVLAKSWQLLSEARRPLTAKGVPTEGHLKLNPNFLLGNSAGISNEIRGLKQEVR